MTSLKYHYPYPTPVDMINLSGTALRPFLVFCLSQDSSVTYLPDMRHMTLSAIHLVENRYLLPDYKKNETDYRKSLYNIIQYVITKLDKQYKYDEYFIVDTYTERVFRVIFEDGNERLYGDDKAKLQYLPYRGLVNKTFIDDLNTEFHRMWIDYGNF